MSFRFDKESILDTCFDIVGWVVEKGVYWLGPVLIVLALAITSLLSFTFFTILLPMMEIKYAGTSLEWISNVHIAFVVFLLTNILFHYFWCVTTRNRGPHYDHVVRELAEATGFQYPETPNQIQAYKREYEDRMILRMQRRRERAAEAIDAKGSTPAHSKTADQIRKTPLRSWMLMGPYEWGYCHKSKVPKPPRSHYDHVTHELVLNLDHYCPWMFNTIGYFNYRYFVSFLIYVFTGMMYGLLLTLESFRLLQTPAYREYSRNEHKLKVHLLRPQPMMPHRDEKMLISLSFMLCLAVGIALVMLGGFHIYLTLTGQTTIEFHANWANRRKAKRDGRKWMNPYDQGYKRNWQQVFGESRWWLALLVPRRRQPDFLPVPIPGQNNRRGAEHVDLMLESPDASAHIV